MMKPEPQWLLDIIALVTRGAYNDSPTQGPGQATFDHHLVMGYDTDNDTENTGFWDTRVYPADINDTVHYELDAVLKVLGANPTVLVMWDHTVVDGDYQGHEVSIELHCHTPKASQGGGDAKPIGKMLDGQPYEEPRTQLVGADFGDDD